VKESDARLGRSESPIGGRFYWLVGGIFTVFAIFALRLFQLQIVEGSDLRARSQRNSVRTLRLEAARGEIMDREGRVLATTRPAYDVAVIPNEVHGRDVTYVALAQLLEKPRAEVDERVAGWRGRERFQPQVVAADLSEEFLARVESHRFALPGVVTAVRPLREYPLAEVTAHVLGSIGEVNAQELTQPEFAAYAAGETIGKSGLEAVLEADLRGRAGGRNVVVDVAGREVDVIDEVEPRRGRTLVLTLDLDLQRAAAEAFAAQKQAENEVVAGALVALDPRTGDVLALASFPSYDPNLFAGGIQPDAWRTLVEDPERPLQNRALMGQYPPGSTYKALVAAAALQEAVITPEARLFCPGSYTLGRRTYRCWKKEGHGSIDLHQALVQSCDVYFYQLGMKLGIDRLALYARGFGLGRLSGIDLEPERPGLVPTSRWKLRRHGEPWQKGETVSASIGQGYNLLTPLQLAVAYAAIANGGHRVVPRLVERVEELDGRAARTLRPAEGGTVPVAPAHLERVARALGGVVQEPHGTGWRARVSGVAVAGKTGTAQVVRLERTADMNEDEIPRRYRDHAWFAAFAPLAAPEIVVVALVEHGGHGGSAAAPIVQRVLMRYFEKRARAVAEDADPRSGERG